MEEVHVIQRHRQAQNVSRFIVVSQAQRQIAEILVEGGAVARGAAHAILVGRNDFRPGGVVFHGLGIVMGIRQGHALRVDNRDARAGTLRGLVRPVFQLGAGNIGGFGLQNSRFRFQPLFHALHFPSGRVARDVEIQNDQGHRNQQEGAGQKLAKYGAA